MSGPPLIRLRRLLNALIGVGPWRTAPFMEIADQALDDCRLGVHRPERHSGVVHEIRTPPVVYAAAHALLDQTPLIETLDRTPRYQASGLSPGNCQRLMLLSDAGIAGNDGVVYCPRSRRAVLETVRGWKSPALHHPLLGASGLPPAEQLQGLSLSLASRDAEGFYHHLTESLPRLHLARAWIPAVDHVLVSGTRTAGREAWFAAAGVPVAKLRWLGGLAHYRCEQLLFADWPMRDSRPTPWIRESLHALFMPVTTGPAARWLWISRSDAATRHLAWEDELLAHFPRFEKIVLSRLTPKEQISLFKDAVVVAGPHGAGLAHLAFTPPGVYLAEFSPDSRYHPLYSRFATLAGGHAAWAAVDFQSPRDLPRLVSALRAFFPACASAP